MIILITGKPGVGKSTLVKKVIDSSTVPASWVLTTEVRDTEGNRVGFSAKNSDGQTAVISHKAAIKSTAIIGQNAVDLHAVDKMFGQVLQQARPNNIVLIDEIGPIQLLSHAFAAALAYTFDQVNQTDMIATIHYNDQQLERYRHSKDAWLFVADPINRDVLAKAVALCMQHMKALNELSSMQKSKAKKLLEKYIVHSAATQIEKLLRNGIYYAANGATRALGDGAWGVAGKHGSYTVHKQDADYACTCELFNGRGKYTANAGECSHVQAVYLTEGLE